MPHRLTITALLVFAGCPRPEVPVDKELGRVGMFCITGSDCETELACLESHCCRDQTCGTTCTSLVEKNSRFNRSAGAHPSVVSYFLRSCQMLCCKGETTDKIEEVLTRAKHRVPGHGEPLRL